MHPSKGASSGILLTGGAHKGAWDSGRYSESRVWWHNGLWHLFATASADGGTAAHPNGDKVNEQIGWMISEDGMNFTEVSPTLTSSFQCEK